MKPSVKVLAIPDLHIPFHHRDALDFLVALAKKQKPDVVVCLGDELDQHAISDHDHDPDGMSPGDELRAALAAIKPFYQAFPDVKVCVSNHGARPYRRAFQCGIPRAYLRDYHDFMGAPPGWRWEDRHDVDGVAYQHGEGVSGPLGALKIAVANGCPTVIGHLHGDAGVQFWANSSQLLWGLNAGWLGDRKAYAAAYAKHSLKRGILGCGIVNRGVPTFIPMLIDGNRRWSGRLA